MSAPSSSSPPRALAVWIAALTLQAAACADQHDAQPADEPLRDAALSSMVLDGGTPAVDASVGSRLDANPDARLDPTLVLPPLDIPEHLCRGDRANEYIWQASRHADRACEQTSDCVALVPQISCSTVCSPLAVSQLGAAQLDDQLSRLERSVCAEPPDNRPCQYGDAAVCTLPPYQPRCFEGQCGHTPVGCPLDQVEQLEGEACSAPGIECLNPGFCPLGVRCSDEAQPGVYRWVLQILLC